MAKSGKGDNLDTTKIKKKLETFLDSFRSNNKQTQFTHVSLGGLSPPGKFCIEDKKNKLKLAKYLAKAHDSGHHFGIAEMPNEYGPIIIDLDFKYPLDEYNTEYKNKGKRLYDDDIIKNVIQIYREHITKYLSLSGGEQNAILFEKEHGSEKNGEYKDGVHIIFPYVCLSSNVRRIIYEDVKEQIASECIFEHYSNQDSVLDAAVNSNAWLMYGCCKPNGIPYTVSKIFDSENNEIPVSTIGDSFEIIQMLSLKDRKWKEKNKNSFNTENGVTEEFIQSKFNELDIVYETKTNYFDENIGEDLAEQIDKAMKLVELLNAKRANNYNDWIRVGWALHNTHHTLLDKWVEFSKRSKKFKDGECDELWERMKSNGGLSLRSLCLWAKEDSPEEYKIFHKEFFHKLLKKNDVNNTFMIAKALYFQYADRFVCSDTNKDSKWYEFKGHRWRKCNSGGSLITLMSSDFPNIYLNEVNEMNNKAMGCEGQEKKSLLTQSEMYNKIAQNLMNIGFKKKILEEAKYLFFDENFQENLDENYDLVGFENGVYDLKQRKFRKGHPDDYISMSTGNKYHKWSNKNPYAKHIKNFFEQVLVNENVRDFFLERLSTCVSGENREEKFYFCTGSGSNGKSLTFQLVSDALGDYYVSCPITIITRKRNASNQASPELARLKGPRAGVFQEPGFEEEINTGIFKELTGNDKFMVRGLYREPKDIKPQAKYWCCCNDLPSITSDDGGTWRRVLVVDFASKFVEEPKEKNEFKIDMKLKDKIKNWAPAFASYLIHIYNTRYNVDTRSPEPEEVKISTGKYRQNQDVLRDFFDNNIIVTDSKDDKVKKRPLYEEFKKWFKLEHDGTTMPKSKKLYEFMDNILKQTYTDSWKMVKFKKDETSESDESDEES